MMKGAWTTVAIVSAIVGAVAVLQYYNEEGFSNVPSSPHSDDRTEGLKASETQFGADVKTENQPAETDVTEVANSPDDEFEPFIGKVHKYSVADFILNRKGEDVLRPHVSVENLERFASEVPQGLIPVAVSRLYRYPSILSVDPIILELNEVPRKKGELSVLEVMMADSEEECSRVTSADAELLDQFTAIYGDVLTGALDYNVSMNIVLYRDHHFSMHSADSAVDQGPYDLTFPSPDDWERIQRAAACRQTYSDSDAQRVFIRTDRSVVIGSTSLTYGRSLHALLTCSHFSNPGSTLGSVVNGRDVVLPSDTKTPAGRPVYDSQLLLQSYDSWSFQHFIDRIYPMVAQSSPFIDDSITTKLTLYDRNHELPNVLLSAFDMPNDVVRMGKYSGRSFRARMNAVACDSPLLHPVLMRRAAKMIVPLPSTEDKERNRERNAIVYCSRTTTTTKNGGRQVKNEEEMLEYMRAEVSKMNELLGLTLEVVIFDEKKHRAPYNVMELMERAVAIVGPHGGALYNMAFASSHLDVVEIFPTTSWKVPQDLFWNLATSLGHTYWRIVPETNDEDSMIVNVRNVREAVRGIASRAATP